MKEKLAMYINQVGKYTNTKKYLSCKARGRFGPEVIEAIRQTPKTTVPDGFKSKYGTENPKIMALWYDLSKHFDDSVTNIRKSCDAILNSDNTINEYAKKTFFALIKGKSANWITNIKNMFKFRSGSYGYGLERVAYLIELCKDNNGNHHKEALDLLGEMESGGTHPDYIPAFLQFCKDNNGIIDPSRVQMLKDYKSRGCNTVYADIIAEVPNSENVVTKKRANFFFHVMEKYNKGKDFSPDITELLKNLLIGTKNDLEDKGIELLDKVFDVVLVNEKEKKVKYKANCFISKDGYIPPENIINLLEYPLLMVMIKGFNPNLLKDKGGIISENNVKQYYSLFNRGFKPLELSKILEIDGMKNPEGQIDKNCVYFVKNNCAFSIEALSKAIKISKNSDETINWDVADEIVQPIQRLLNYKDNKYLTLFENAIKTSGENGAEFNMNRINNLKEIANMPDINILLKNLEGKTLDEMAEGKNLYIADNLLEILKQLKNDGRLTLETLNAPIKDYDSNLFWLIIELPLSTRNTEAYPQIAKLLSEIEGLDYNKKDKFGISVLAKVIHAKKEELLDVIINNSKELIYSPELEGVYKNIQDTRFEKLLKDKLIFNELEASAKLCSVNIFDVLKNQLNSAFCDKERVIRKLFDIAKEQKGTEVPPDVYVYHLLDEFGSELNKDLFTEMLNWQVAEREKRVQTKI